MMKMVCDICMASSFTKEGDQFVCGGCGCRYSLSDARGLLREVDEPSAPTPPAPQHAEPPVPRHVSDAENRVLIRIGTVGHSTYQAGFLSVNDVFVEGPDEVGHIGYEVYVKNLQGKPIKYVRLVAQPYNAVGDRVSCEATGVSDVMLRVTGPLMVGEDFDGRHEGAWYNHSIVAVRVAQAEVEYLDGTKELYTADTYDFENGHLYGNATKHRVQVFVEDRHLHVPPMSVRVDSNNSYRLHKGEQALFDIDSGPHTLYVDYQWFKEQFPLDVYNDVCVSVGYSNLSGQITVRCVDMMPMTAEVPKAADEPIVTPPPASATSEPDITTAAFGGVPHTASSPNRISVDTDMLGHWAVTDYDCYGQPIQEFCSDADAAGNIGCRLAVSVISGKAIRRATMFVTPYSASGMKLSCNTTGDSLRSFTVEGPIYSGSPQLYTFACVWRNPVVAEVRVERVLVEYLDGSREVYDNEHYAFNRGMMKSELSDKTYTLTVVRKSQFSHMNTEMTVTIGDTCYTVDNGQSVDFVLSGGDYEMMVLYDDVKVIVDIELDESLKYELSINAQNRLEIKALDW